MFWKTHTHTHIHTYTHTHTDTQTHTQEEFYSSQFLQRKFIQSPRNDFQRIEKPRGVSTCKTMLFPHLKESQQLFWQNLPVNVETVDLIANRDLSE